MVDGDHGSSMADDRPTQQILLHALASSTWCLVCEKLIESFDKSGLNRLQLQYVQEKISQTAQKLVTNIISDWSLFGPASVSHAKIFPSCAKALNSWSPLLVSPGRLYSARLAIKRHSDLEIGDTSIESPENTTIRLRVSSRVSRTKSSLSAEPYHN